MKLKKIILTVGILLLLLAVWSTWDAVTFLKRSELVQASITGYSGMRGMEREAGECTALSKGCAATVFYTLKNGGSFTTQVSQPYFARAKQESVTLAVDPHDPQNPRIASVHVLFRNPMVWFAFGFVLTAIPAFLLKGQKVK